MHWPRRSSSSAGSCRHCCHLFLRFCIWSFARNIKCLWISSFIYRNNHAMFVETNIKQHKFHWIVFVEENTASIFRVESNILPGRVFLTACDCSLTFYPVVLWRCFGCHMPFRNVGEVFPNNPFHIRVGSTSHIHRKQSRATLLWSRLYAHPRSGTAFWRRQDSHSSPAQCFAGKRVTTVQGSALEKGESLLSSTVLWRMDSHSCPGQ
jgi:hypothetical protein